jgi:lysophospholipase L1-like esterase
MGAPCIRWATASKLALLIVCVCCGIAPVFTTSPSIAASSIAADWTVEPLVTPVGAQRAALQAVSCTEANACTAVGSSEEGTSGATPLAEIWNGSRWLLSDAVTGTPGSNLSGVSCPVTGWCAAVGSDSQDGFAETWNGTLWTQYTIAAPSGSQSFTLRGVSCTSPNYCLAVGSYVDESGYANALVDDWNGSIWTEGNAVAPNPRGTPYDANSALYAISCASLTSCVAVGEYEDEPDDTDPALAESWNGSTWTVDSTPMIPDSYQISLNSISCWAPGSCMAVGSYDIFGNPPPEGNTTSESWDGSAWHLQSAPVLPETFSDLHAISCASATFCAGLGYGSPGANYVALWDSAWSYEAFGTALDALSCISETYCVAVGAEDGAVYGSNPANPPPLGGGGSSPAPPTLAPTPLPPSISPIYAAIGDSYSSGEGDPPFLAGSATSQDTCHRSTTAYAERLHGTPGFPAMLDFVACSGARIANMYPNKGQHGETDQLDTLNDDDALVTLTIGGNDVQFPLLIKSCVVLAACYLADNVPTRGLIAHTVKRLLHLYQEVLKRAANAQIYVLGYPEFFSHSPSFLCNGIDRLEADWITKMENLMDEGIHNVIKKINSHRLHYVDTAKAFAGGELCSSGKPVYVNGVIKSHLQYSFHPTAAGQDRLAQVLAEAVRGR